MSKTTIKTDQPFPQRRKALPKTPMIDRLKQIKQRENERKGQR